MSNRSNCLQRALNNSAGKVLFLDGGLATHLETLGQDLNDKLWSAKLLITNPAIITRSHYDYLCSGSNIIITSSYQASIKGFISDPYNLSVTDAVDKLSESVVLANNAINQYYANETIKNKTKNIMIAASIGCYGAGLADGSEYTGYYGTNVNERELRMYHSIKMHSAMEMQKSLKSEIILACETIPNVMEVKVLTQLLNDWCYNGWITMACCNEYQLNSKEFVADAIDTIIEYNTNDCVVGIGFNCCHPKHIDGLLKLTNKCLKAKNAEFIIIVYANSGEEWDAVNKKWKEHTTMSDEQYALMALYWYKLGANIIGGCCRTTPSTICTMKQKILKMVKCKL